MIRFKKIYVEITNICNLKCPFCSVDNREKKEMKLEEFENVLIKINDYTDYVYLHVKGEPLLHSKFEQILDLCKKYNKKVNITTNATLLEQKLESIIKSSVRQVNISLQSIVDINIVKNIIRCADILAENDIKVQYRMWVEIEKENEILKLLETRYNVKINSEKNNIKLDENIYFNKDKEFIWPSLDNDILQEEGTCYGTRTHIGILSDGTVIPCCLDSKGIISLGNIFKCTMEELVDGKRFKNMRKNFQNNKLCEELCKKCGFAIRRQNKE